MSDRVCVVARFKAKEGQGPKLREMLLNLVQPSRSDEGCIKYDVHQAIEDPTLFYFYEIWQSRELLDKHGASKTLSSFREAAKDVFGEPPQVTVLTKISD